MWWLVAIALSPSIVCAALAIRVMFFLPRSVTPPPPD
jgi:hypothetical protein